MCGRLGVELYVEHFDSNLVGGFWPKISWHAQPSSSLRTGSYQWCTFPWSLQSSLLVQCWFVSCSVVGVVQFFCFVLLFIGLLLLCTSRSCFLLVYVSVWFIFGLVSAVLLQFFVVELFVVVVIWAVGWNAARSCQKEEKWQPTAKLQLIPIFYHWNCYCCG